MSSVENMIDLYAKALKKWAKEYAEWQRRGGKEGRGGPWDKFKQVYTHAEAPKEPDRPNYDESLKKILDPVFDGIRKKYY